MDTMNIGIYHTEIHFVTVPNQTPNITKIYLTSASSFKVFWVTPGDETIDGYRVAYRSLEGGGGWSTLAVDKQTSSIHLKKLPEGTVYVVRVLAFNSHGNGIPGEAKEIKMDEGGSFMVILRIMVKMRLLLIINVLCCKSFGMY